MRVVCLFDNVPAGRQLQFESADLAKEVADDVEGRQPGADLTKPFRTKFADKKIELVPCKFIRVGLEAFAVKP
jgi:hypothetical protein